MSCILLTSIYNLCLRVLLIRVPQLSLYSQLFRVLVMFGFTHRKYDHYMFIYSHQGVIIYALVYVDDILITSSSSMLVQKLIDEKFSFKKLDTLEYFLSVDIKHLDSRNHLLAQTKYILDLLTKANMRNVNGVTIPMLSNCRLNNHGASSLPDRNLYHSMLEALKYVTLTRTHIAFSVSKTCQFTPSPLESHWSVVKCILRYLTGTINHDFMLSPCPSSGKIYLCAYSGSDWSIDHDDRCSTSDSCILFGPNLISGNSKKHNLLAWSSTKDKYHTLAHTTSYLLWLEYLLTKLHVPFHSSML